jgi:methyl-accepting chemotaxis protein
MIRQIATASEEQSKGAEEISQNVEAINTVTVESASGADRLAKAAENLNNQTLDLGRLVGQFKLRDDIAKREVKSRDKAKHNGGVSSLLVNPDGQLENMY